MLTNFLLDGLQVTVKFMETMPVKEGVSCDVYRFMNDNSKDLAIVMVKKGQKTPLQRVLLGTKTIEGYISGEGSLTVRSSGANVKVYNFPSGEDSEVEIKVGQIMQWHANGEADLVFYEVCEPPYRDGRFENLAG